MNNKHKYFINVCIPVIIFMNISHVDALPQSQIHARATLDVLSLNGVSINSACKEISGVIDNDIRVGMMKGNHRYYGHWGFSDSIPFESNYKLRNYIESNPGEKERIIKEWREAIVKMERIISKATGIPIGKQAKGLAGLIYDIHILQDYKDKIIEPLQDVSRLKRDVLKNINRIFGNNYSLSRYLKSEFAKIPKDLSDAEQAKLILEILREQ